MEWTREEFAAAVTEGGGLLGQVVQIDHPALPSPLGEECIVPEGFDGRLQRTLDGLPPKTAKRGPVAAKGVPNGCRQYSAPARYRSVHPQFPRAPCPR